MKHTQLCLDWRIAFGVAECTCASINVVSLTQPLRGAVVAFYCEECKRTTFMVDSLMRKPKDGDYWGIQMCPDNPLHGVEWRFNTRMLPPLKPILLAPDPETIFPSIY